MPNVIGQWTTPSPTIYVPDALFTEASKIVVTFRQGNYTFDKTDPEVIDDEHIKIDLTQQETGKLVEGKVKAMVNYIINGKRSMTYELDITVIDNLKDELL